MRHQFFRRQTLPLFALPFLVACGAAAAAQSVPVAGEAAAAAQSVPVAGEAASTARLDNTATSQAVAAGPLVFQVMPQQSRATFRVREQLAGFELPNDAIGSTGAVSGQIVLSPEGPLLGEGSKITVDLRQLQSDSTQRDTFIRQNTLQTGRYPLAEFVPTRAEGLPSPWPTSGQYVFTLTGPMTIHGVQKEVTWQASATREGDQLTGRATTVITFGDFGMAAPRVPVVLSVTDEIHLELDLVATLAT